MNQSELERLLGYLRQIPAMQAKMNIGKGIKIAQPNIEKIAVLRAIDGASAAGTPAASTSARVWPKASADEV